jgi:sugar lactone lactonase YvrE
MLRGHAHAFAHAKVAEKCDWQGRFWVGSMNNAIRGLAGVFFRLDHCATPAPGYSLLWSPDGQTIHLAGSHMRIIYTHAFDPVTGKRKIFVRTVQLRGDGSSIQYARITTSRDRSKAEEKTHAN